MAFAGPGTIKPMLPANFVSAEKIGAEVVFIPLRGPSSKAVAQPRCFTKATSRFSFSGCVIVYRVYRFNGLPSVASSSAGGPYARATLPCAEA